jgi:hypothetical protein
MARLIAASRANRYCRAIECSAGSCQCAPTPRDSQGDAARGAVERRLHTRTRHGWSEPDSLPAADELECVRNACGLDRSNEPPYNHAHPIVIERWVTALTEEAPPMPTGRAHLSPTAPTLTRLLAPGHFVLRPQLFTRLRALL